MIHTGELLTAKLFMQGHTVPCTLLAQVTCQQTAVATKIEAKHTLRERERTQTLTKLNSLGFSGTSPHNLPAKLRQNAEAAYESAPHHSTV